MAVPAPSAPASSLFFAAAASPFASPPFFAAAEAASPFFASDFSIVISPLSTILSAALRYTRSSCFFKFRTPASLTEEITRMDHETRMRRGKATFPSPRHTRSTEETNASPFHSLAHLPLPHATPLHTPMPLLSPAVLPNQHIHGLVSQGGSPLGNASILRGLRLEVAARDGPLLIRGIACRVGGVQGQSEWVRRMGGERREDGKVKQDE